MNKNNRWRPLLMSLLTVLLVTGIVGLALHKHTEELYQTLCSLTPGGGCALIAAGMWVPVMDAIIFKYITHKSHPGFLLKNAIEIVFLKVFCSVSTFSAGTIPMQGFYLSRHGFEPGEGVGIVTIAYILHKLSVVLFALLMILLQHHWIRTITTMQQGLIVAGVLISVLFIGVLLLLCASKTVKNLVQTILQKLPERGGWKKRGQGWCLQLDELYQTAHGILADRKQLAGILGVNCLKLMGLCAIPQLCMSLLGINTLSLRQTEVLVATTLLISGVMPNIAGVGSIELAFLLLFTDLIGAGTAAATLMLYRISTYYVPFFVSIIIFLRIQRRHFHKK